MASRLRDLAPNWRPYRDLGAEGIRAQLGEHGVRVAKADGILAVRAVRVRLALSACEDDGEGTEEE